MKKRVLWGSLFLVMLLVAPTVVFGKTYEWRVASGWEKNHMNVVPLLHLMDVVNKKCETKDGRVVLKWVGGPETFKYKDLPDACKFGSIDFFFSSNVWYTGIVPQSAFTMLPYAWSFDNVSEMWHSGIEDLVDRAWQKKGLKVVGFESILYLYLFDRKPFSKLSDFKGKKLRVPGGIFSFIPALLGAVSTPLHSSEVFGAMERGTIDGGLQPIVSYVQYSYWEVAPYVLDHPLPYIGAWYWMNLKEFNSVPKSLQEKFLEIVREEETFAVDFWRKGQKEWVETMKGHGVKFITLSPDDQRDFAKTITKLNDKLAEQVPPEESNALFKIYERFSK